MNKEVKKESERVFVPAFNKYLDELTPEEWAQAANATCGLTPGNTENC